MKTIMKKFLATTIATLILVSCSGFLNVIASEIELQEIAEAKISDELKTRMMMRSSGNIPVTIWMDDIDMEAVQEETLSDTTISHAPAIVRTMTEASPVHDLAYLQEYGTNEEIQNYIETKRARARKAYTEQNQAFIAILPAETEITFVSEYSPVIEAKLSNSEINSVARNNSVTSLKYNDPTPSQDATSQSIPITGADYVRDTQGHKGAGVKIGQIETGVPSSFDVSYIRVGTGGSATTHATMVAQIMKSVAPSAQLYCAIVGSNYKTGIEGLLSSGVNIINMSCVWNNDDTMNRYDARSQWMDHIAFNHDVHLVLAAGNEGNKGSEGSNRGSAWMSYNAIVVGNINDQNSATPSNWIRNPSSGFYTGSDLAHKPDISAPGTDITTDAGTGSGTSFSTPLVAGIIAQLCSYKSALKTQQDAIKALLIGGAHKDRRFTPSDSLYAQLGAGMIDARGTRWVINQGRYHSDLFTPSISAGTTRTYNVIVGSTDSSLHVALCFLKKNVFSGSDHSGTPPTMGSTADLDLTVTGPDGVSASSMSSSNNTEIIHINNPPAGTYTIKVTLYTNSDQNVPYAIAWR